MTKQRQDTPQTKAVISALLRHGSLYGAQIRHVTGLKSGTLYPILARLEARGRIMGIWEKESPQKLMRPRRKIYSLPIVASGVSA